MNSPTGAMVADGERATGPDAPRAGREEWVPWAATWVGIVSGAAVMSLIYVMALHGERGNFVGMLALLVCVLAALFDAWTTRIPNRLNYGAILLGLGLNAAAGVCERMHFDAATRWLGAAGPSQSGLGFGVCAVLGVVGFVVARVGGGDIKLLAAVGAMLGLSQTGAVLLVALSVAVVYAVINLALAGRLNSVARVAACRTLEMIYLRRMEVGEASAGAGSLSIPMAVPLAIGVVLAQAMDVRTMPGGHG